MQDHTLKKRILVLNITFPYRLIRPLLLSESDVTQKATRNLLNIAKARIGRESHLGVGEKLLILQTARAFVGDYWRRHQAIPGADQYPQLYGRLQAYGFRDAGVDAMLADSVREYELYEEMINQGSDVRNKMFDGMDESFFR